MIRLKGINLAGRDGLNSQLLFTTLHSYPELRPPRLYCTITRVLPYHPAPTKSNFTSAIAKDDIGTPTLLSLQRAHVR